MRRVAVGLCVLALTACDGGDGLPPIDAVCSEVDEPKGASDLATLTVGDVMVNQAVRRPLVVDGKAAESDVPLLAGRRTLMRFFYEAEGSADVTALLDVGEERLELPTSVSGTSTDDDLDSTLSFEIPAGTLSAGDNDWELTVCEGDGRVAELSAEADTTLTMDGVGEQMRLVLVPVTVEATGRTPDFDEARQQALRDAVRARFPVADVEIVVDEPLSFFGEISGSGAGWPDLMGAIGERRRADGAAPSTFHIGLVEPAPSLAEACMSGCISWLSGVAEAFQPETQFAAILGYEENFHSTALSLVAFMHGRLWNTCNQAPSPQQIDPDYPYPDGQSGVWGYDTIAGDIHSPDTLDMVTQCQGEVWVSDYTYRALYERWQLIAAESGGGG